MVLSVLWFVDNPLALFWPSCESWPISQDVGSNGSIPLWEMPCPENVCPCTEGKYPQSAHVGRSSVQPSSYTRTLTWTGRGCTGAGSLFIDTFWNHRLVPHEQACQTPTSHFIIMVTITMWKCLYSQATGACLLGSHKLYCREILPICSKSTVLAVQFCEWARFSTGC